MAYNTGNPVPSRDPRDLVDNAENLDRAVNGEALTFDDRLGKQRKSFAGMESEFSADQQRREDAFQSFLERSGYQDIGTYGSGLEITERNQIFLKDGEYYRASAALALPYTTTGDWATEGGQFVSVGDAALRQQLASPSGAAMVGNAVMYVDSISDLLALNVEVLKEGQQIQTPEAKYVISDSPDGRYGTVAVGDKFALYRGSLSPDDLISITEGATLYAGPYPNNQYSGDFTKFIPGNLPGVRIWRDVNGHFGYSADPGASVGAGTYWFFVSSSGSGSGDGQTPANPKTFPQLQAEAATGDYDGVASLHMYLMDDIYYLDDSLDSFGIFPCRLYITSVHESGESWLTSAPRLEWGVESIGGKPTWSAVSGDEISAMCNYAERDAAGLPIPYGPVASLNDLVPGSFFYDASVGKVYAEPFRQFSRVETQFMAMPSNRLAFDFRERGGVTFVRGVSFFTLRLRVEPTVRDLQLFERCKFMGGGADALAVKAPSYTAVLLECVGGWAGKDIFNYHNYDATAEDQGVAVEVNCLGYGAGVYKYAGGNTTTHSNNGSTAHDGSTVIRLGSRYWNCQGPVVADVNGCKSINYGVLSGDVADGATGAQAAFYFNDDAALGYAPRLALMVDCAAKGNNLDNSIRVETETFVYDGLTLDESKVRIDSATVEKMQ